ncbi:HET-domain-containing protein, partial [Canariomyces notabilis]
MPLAQGETRVLILEPGAESNPVVCRLEHMAIPGVATHGTESNAPEKDFIALSYAWGSPVRTHVITCNQLPFAVTTNLFHALYYLRRSDQSQCLWVDAICINQDNIPERNEQVRHMLAIYQASSRVIVWLG